HPAVESMTAGSGKQEDWWKAVRLEHACQSLATGDGTIDGGGVLEGDVEKRHAGADDLDRHLRPQVGDRKAQRGGHALSLVDDLAKLGGRMRHPQDDLFSVAIDA